MVEINDDLKIVKFDDEIFSILEYKKVHGNISNTETIITNKFVEKTFFTFFPIYLNKNFRWFEKVTLTKQLFIVRYASFDDGWDYTMKWGHWKKKWIWIKIK